MYYTLLQWTSSSWSEECLYSPRAAPAVEGVGTLKLQANRHVLSTPTHTHTKFTEYYLSMEMQTWIILHTKKCMDSYWYYRVGVDFTLPICSPIGSHLSSSTSTTHLVLTVVVDWRGRPRCSDFLQQEMSVNWQVDKHRHYISTDTPMYHRQFSQMKQYQHALPNTPHRSAPLTYPCTGYSFWVLPASSLHSPVLQWPCQNADHDCCIQPQWTRVVSVEETLQCLFLSMRMGGHAALRGETHSALQAGVSPLRACPIATSRIGCVSAKQRTPFCLPRVVLQCFVVS